MGRVPDPRVNRPLWLEEVSTVFPPLDADRDVDVAVIGAGITGVTAAYLLKAAGKRVALVEATRVGFGATGYTTAKLTVGHNLIYRELVDSFGVEIAASYARSNQEAIDSIADLVQEHGIDCDFEPTSNYVYVEDESAVADIEQEVVAAQAAGVAAELTTDTDLPYEVAAAVRVDRQAQFHPWKYVAALARLVDGDGSYVFESTRATHVQSATPCAVETANGRVRAPNVVVATQLPFLDRSLFFSKAHPMKSYAIAATVNEDKAPRGMYISANQPTRSVRSTPAQDGRRLLIIGGEGHKPGNDPRALQRYARLETFARERFGIPSAEYRWSTHDYTPLDHLPYIGRVQRGDPHVLMATGFAKWGMTKGTLAAMVLTDAILGRSNEYAELYDANRLDLRRSAFRFAKENATVGAFFFRDRVRRRDKPDAIERLGPGEGTIIRAGAKQYAVYRDDEGTLHTLSARCTHLGCIVGWNPADRAWECPCHGSRFTAEGTLVQGPATLDLRREALRA